MLRLRQPTVGRCASVCSVEEFIFQQQKKATEIKVYLRDFLRFLWLHLTRPVSRILCGGVLTRPKWTKLLKWISSSKETVMLRRWGRSEQKFGFIKRVDKC